MQIDFMQPGGKLYVPGAEKLASRIEQLTQFAAEHRIPIIASACAHVPSDPEQPEPPISFLMEKAFTPWTDPA